MHLPFPLPVLPPHYFCIICAYLLISFLLSHLRVALSNPLVPVSSPPIHLVTPFRSSSRSHRGSPRLRKVADICHKPSATTFRVTRFFTLRSFTDTRGRAISSRFLEFHASARRARRTCYRFHGVVSLRIVVVRPRASSVYLKLSADSSALSVATYETPNRLRRDDSASRAGRISKTKCRLNLRSSLALKVSAFHSARALELNFLAGGRSTRSSA